MGTQSVQNAIPSPGDDVRIISQTSSSDPARDDTSPAKKTLTPKDFILSVARKTSAQPLRNTDPGLWGVWGVLTAISNNSWKRPQGINLLLTANEHCIGRLVKDKRFQIESNAVSGSHCKISRKRIATEDVGHSSSFITFVFLEDTSTNGTYVNWGRLRKNSFEVKLQHGDIISFPEPPQHELAFTFVYRECIKSALMMDGAELKRKAEEFGSESKRLRGIGVGAPEGPFSLDDVRSLQRSNTELRKQLESNVLTIETLQKENRAVLDQHETEMEDLKGSVSQSYLDQIKELRHMCDIKQKEVVEVSTLLVDRQHAMEYLNKRLRASMQSRNDANEIINRWFRLSKKYHLKALEETHDGEDQLFLACIPVSGRWHG